MGQIKKWFGGIRQIFADRLLQFGGYGLVAILFDGLDWIGTAQTADDTFGFLKPAVTWMNAHWFAKSLVLIAGIALIVWGERRRSNNLYADKAKPVDLAQLERRLREIEGRRQVLESLALAYLLDSQVRVYKEARDAESEAWDVACAALREVRPVVPERVLLTTRVARIGVDYRAAIKRLEGATRPLRHPWPNEIPDKAQPLSADGYDDSAKQAYIALCAEHMTVRHRIALYEERFRPFERQASARSRIEEFARDLLEAK